MKNKFIELIKLQREEELFDLHLNQGSRPRYRDRGGHIQCFEKEKKLLTSDDMNQILGYLLDDVLRDQFKKNKQVNFSREIEEYGRFRISVYEHHGGIGLVVRIIPLEIPTPEDLDLPRVVVDLVSRSTGILFVVGPNNAGKTTVLNSLIDHINKNDTKNVVTLEDPIEFAHTSNKSVIVQREIGRHFDNYVDGLSNVLRQDANIVVVGEMRDKESFDLALNLCISGYFVITTLHTIDAVQTVERIIDLYPPEFRKNIQLLLSMVIQGVLCQELIPGKSGEGVVPCREVLIPDDAIRSIIKKGEFKKIYNHIQLTSSLGNFLYDKHLVELYQDGEITKQTFYTKMHDISVLESLLSDEDMSGVHTEEQGDESGMDIH